MINRLLSAKKEEQIIAIYSSCPRCKFIDYTLYILKEIATVIERQQQQVVLR